ncbi:MAG: hypothetical protein K2X44_10555 [Magnetospirillum sp.]|nr:hypothetical protein [Magnetospirillum sp.]
MVVVVASAAPARADFCMLTQNGLHLGQGQPAYRESKRDGFKAIFKDYDVVNLQEVMDPAEPARLAPAGFTVSVSVAKGQSTYREYYAVLTRNAAIRVLDHADYPDDAGDFARPPFGIAVEDSHKSRYWLVDIHAVFGKGGVTPRRMEVAAMAQVTAFYAGRVLADGTMVERVVVVGDWNLPATDKAFVELEQMLPGTLAAPNVKSSLNARGEYASAYDHFVWNRHRMNVDFADDPRDTGGFDLESYRDSLSDHAGVAGYVLAAPGRLRPEGISCPPVRVGAGS